MTAIEQIAEKVRTNREHKGYTAEHDDKHTSGEIACAAACYTLVTVITAPSVQDSHVYARYWPWERASWKPSDDPIRNLVHAGALIVAEIERLQRRK